jgi:hypothetical protein
MRQETDSTGELSTADKTSSRGKVQAVAAIGFFVGAAAALALARNGEPPFVDILYAEDGTVFYSEALTMGLGSIARPYAGYINFVPRVASEMIALLPVDKVAAAYSVAATVLVAFLALYTFFASRVLLDSWAGRALLAGAVIVPPVAGQTIANVSNLHWYLMFAAFWALISNPRNAGWTIAGATVGAAAALSDPLTALFLPSAALAMHRYRSRMHGFVVAAVVVAMAVQLLVVSGAEQRAGAESSWFDLPVLYALRVAGGVTIGDVHLTSAWLRAGWSVPVVAIVAVTLVVVLAIARTQKWRQVIVIAAAFYSVAFFGLSLLIRGTTPFIPVAGVPPPVTGRYTLLPALFLIVCVAVLVDLAVVERSLKNALTGGIAAAWLVSVIAANYFIAPLPNGPSWGESMEAARLQCSSESTSDVEVAIAPHPAWKVRLSCADL